MKPATTLAFWFGGILLIVMALTQLRAHTGMPLWAYLALCALGGLFWDYDRARHLLRRRDTPKRRPARRRRRHTRRAQNLADIRTAAEWVIHHDPRSVVDEQAYQRLRDANTIRPVVRHALETAWVRKTWRMLAPRHGMSRCTTEPITLDKETP